MDALGELYCIDDTRLYAIGYSLGSMFTYEVACQLNQRFAAVASFAGTMPVAPETCDLVGSMAVMHVHGKLDMIIDYDDDWDWKDGEHEGVGTMSNIPGMIDAGRTCIVHRRCRGIHFHAGAHRPPWMFR